MDKRLKELEKQYKDVPIPKELDDIIEGCLEMKPKKPKFKAPKWLLGSAAALALVTATVNVSPAVARNLADIPGLGTVINVLTFVNYEMEEDYYSANIEVPKVNGNSTSIEQLNEQYAAEGKALYEAFQLDMEAMEQNGGGHLSVDSGYKILTDTDNLLVVGRYVVTTIGSANEVIRYATIDKQKEIVVTLPSLFKNDRYISLINDYILEEMNKDKDIYFIDRFTSIQPDHNFYITKEGKLVIVFDEYEVAAGAWGIIEFEIPTDLLADVLISNEYIK